VLNCNAPVALHVVPATNGPAQNISNLSFDHYRQAAMRHME